MYDIPRKTSFLFSTSNVSKGKFFNPNKISEGIMFKVLGSV